MKPINVHSSPGKNMLLWFTVIMIVRITSYFMLSESAAITQVFKIGFRFLVTGISFVMLRNFLIQHKSHTLKYPYPLAIIFYLAYLLLGMFSLIWTSKISDSLLQLLMDIECLAFSILYISVLYAYNSTKENPIRLSKILSFSIFIIMVVFIAGMFVNPDKFYRLTHGGEVARLGGFIINPNELGMLIVTGFAMCCSELKFVRNKVLTLLMMGVLIYTLVLTGSRSSMIGMFLILLFYIKKVEILNCNLLC